MKAGNSICLRLLAGAALCLMALTFPAWADPPGRVGRISYMTGPVSFNGDPDGDEWTAAMSNYPLTTGNRLWTDAGARAEVRIGAVSVLLDERTALGFTRLDDDAVELYVSQGSVAVSLRETTQDEPILVMSPDTSVTLTGHARYRIRVSPGGDRTDITVRRGGEAEIAAGASVFSAYEDQTATVSGIDRVNYDIATAPPPDDFEHWARERDRRSAPPQTAQFVSPETTGYEDLDSYGNWRSTAEYGAVWIPSNVTADWAPYRFGHWASVAPWGWTWVDDAPWGFAPFHYGRWAYVGTTWAWVPGRIVARPVYAPALVAFVDAPQLTVAFGLRDHCGWVPLAPREAYVPWYQVSTAYVRNVNVTHGSNGANGGIGFAYVNRTAPGAVTVVPNQLFARGQPVNTQVSRNVRIDDNLANRFTTGTPPNVQLEPARRMFPLSPHRPPPESASRLTSAVSPAFRARPVEPGEMERQRRPGDDRDAGRSPPPGGPETRGAPGRAERPYEEARPPRRLGPPMVAPGRPAVGGGAPRAGDERDEERRAGSYNGEPQYQPPARPGAGNEGRSDERRAPPPQAASQMPPAGRPIGGNDGRGEERRAPPPQAAPQMPAAGRPAGGNDGRGEERRAPPPQAAPQMPPPGRPAGGNDGHGEERRVAPQPAMRAAPVAAPAAAPIVAAPAPLQERRAEPPPERQKQPTEPPRNGTGERRERAPGDPRNGPPGGEKPTARPTN